MTKPTDIFPARLQPSGHLVEAYMRAMPADCGSIPSRQNTSSKIQLRRASQLIGQGCVRLARREQIPGNNCLLQAQAALSSMSDLANNQKDALATERDILQTTLNHIKYRRSPQLAAARSALHDTIINGLTHSMNYIDSPHVDNWVGTINELTVVGLQSRNPQPGRMSLFSLRHHDKTGYNSDRRGSYDSLFIESIPDKPSLVQKVEVKSCCVMDCESPIDTVRGRKLRSAYFSDITIISGHCDLGYRSDAEEVSQKFPLAHLLLQEAAGELDIHGKTTLDDASASLVDTIKNNTSRRGTAVA